MALTTNNLKIVFGGGAFILKDEWSDERVAELLDFLEKVGINTIDTAESYGESEVVIGRSKAAARGFEIDSKVSGGLNSDPSRDTSKENVIKAGEASLSKLGTDKLDVYYIHAPDRKVPFKDTLEGINELYKAGKFKRFGISNFRPDEVEEVVRIAKENNFVLPSVYQSNYNAVGRLAETQLFPILRKHNISFYAYSPIAGGFLTKTPQEVTDGKGRFEKNGGFFSLLYNGLYNKPSMLEFLSKFGNIARDEGISQAELAHRWIVYHSSLDPKKGDAIIIGSRFGSQFLDTLEGLKKGPLSKEAVDRLDDAWKGVEKDAILDNYNDFISKMQG